MGRRSQHPPELLREMIIDAAEGIVAEGGLGLLSAREIAKRIDYSPGTLYNIFENLDDVVVTLEGRILDRMAAELDKAAAETRDSTPTERLIALTRTYMAFTHQHARLWSLLFEHRLPAHQELPGWYLDKLAALLAQIESALQPYFAASDRAARQRSARVLWSAVHGIASLSTSGKLAIITPQAAPDMAEDLVHTYLAGLTGPRND